MKNGKGTKGFPAALCFMGLLVLLLTFSLVRKEWAQKETFQSIVALNGMEYGEDLLKEAEKLPGIKAIAPVLDIPVRLKIGDYETDTVLYGAELENLRMEVSDAAETLMGSQPTLLMGENALASMADRNGHMISKEQQKRFLQDFREIDISVGFAAEEGGQETPCRVAGILKIPDDRIFLPYAQAEEILKSRQMDTSIKTILLTIQGKENQEQALSYFNSGS